jgi:hypothetical protein
MPLQRAMVDRRIDVLTCIGVRSLKKAACVEANPR